MKKINIAQVLYGGYRHASNDEGSDRIVEFMRSGAKGFASVEEAADAVSGYLPHRERPKIYRTQKNLDSKKTVVTTGIGILFSNR